jgi:undecaprenol kinase
MNLDSAGKQTEKNRHFGQSLHHAWGGVVHVVKQERNMRFHLLAAVGAILLGWLLKVSTLEWLWLALAIFTVISAEFTNTVVEALVDLIVHHHYDLGAKYAKDAAAGAVLCAAVFAVVVGLLIFLPRLMKLMQ